MKQKQLTSQHLHWLLISLMTVLLLHSVNLPLWITVVALAFGIWRYLLNKKQWALPRMRILIPVMLIICIGLILSFGRNFGRDASISLFIIMAAMKLLETKTLRDYMLVISIAYFAVASLFMFSQSATTFLLSLVPITLLTTTLIQISLPQTTSNIFSLKLAAKILLQSVPLMLVLFVLFPRLPGPIWGISKDAYSGMTGLNDSIELGDVSNLIQNSSVAFRVQFDGAIPPRSRLYWRGPVLSQQQNNKWLTTDDNSQTKQASLEPIGTTINYTMTLEPHNRLWLLLLDMPTTIPKIAMLKQGYSAVAKEPIRTRTRYQATSSMQYILDKTVETPQYEIALAIDPDSNPKSFKLARDWSYLTPEQIISKALQMFNQQAFIYTLRPPRLSNSAIDDFLFKTKKGFCEHYASSFVYLMRAAGVPARIVTGYQGGEINPNGNYLIVRQSDAHAWAEVWLKEKGWVRIDPTAAVAPERIELGIDQAVTEVDALPMFVRPGAQWLKDAYFSWDNLNNNWNQWVLGYDNQKQLDFLEKISGKDLTMADIAIWMIAIMLMMMLVMAAFLLRRQSLTLNPAQKAYAKHVKQLDKHGLNKHPSEGALDFAHRAAKEIPEQAAIILEIATLYNALQYSTQKTANQSLQLLKDRIQDFKPARHD
ncbi:MAG: transglutaminase TgpA family protein [Methylophilaceae bacterium]